MTPPKPSSGAGIHLVLDSKLTPEEIARAQSVQAELGGIARAKLLVTAAAETQIASAYETIGHAIDNLRALGLQPAEAAIEALKRARRDMQLAQYQTSLILRRLK